MFDTNRMWSAHLPLLIDLFPGARLIACVRNVAWVMDSIERRYRANPYETTRLFNDDTERNTVYSRVDTLAQRNRMVGYPWAALRKLSMASTPHRCWWWTTTCWPRRRESHAAHLPVPGEPEFGHDFGNVRYDAPDFDDALGLHGLHKVRSSVAFQARQTILPPDLF